MARHSSIDSRRASLALLAVVLLIGGAILGHPEMIVADNCTGYQELGCTTGSQCPALCATLTDAIPCTGHDWCGVVAGICSCYLDP